MVDKSTKQQVNYREGTSTKCCNICTMYNAHSCSVVEGKISPSDLCDLFKRKKMTAEELTESQKYCKIQIQDQAGVWRDRSTTINDSQYIRRAMASTQMSYPKYRVRAISFDGSVLDILTPGSSGPR